VALELALAQPGGLATSVLSVRRGTGAVSCNYLNKLLNYCRQRQKAKQVASLPSTSLLDIGHTPP
jgi:hypothetical protein